MDSNVITRRRQPAPMLVAREARDGARLTPHSNVPIASVSQDCVHFRRVDALRGQKQKATELTHLLLSVPGVQGATADSWTGSIWVYLDHPALAVGIADLLHTHRVPGFKALRWDLSALRAPERKPFPVGRIATALVQGAALEAASALVGGPTVMLGVVAWNLLSTGFSHDAVADAASRSGAGLTRLAMA